MEQVILVKLDRTAEGKALAKEHNLRGAPAFLLMDENGKLIHKWVGYNKAKFINALKTGLSKAEGP